jgi:hypothetical protein
MCCERRTIDDVQEQQVGRSDRLDEIVGVSRRSGIEDALQQLMAHDTRACAQPFDNGSQAPALIRNPIREQARRQIIPHAAIESVERRTDVTLPLFVEGFDRSGVGAYAACRQRRDRLDRTGV